MCFGGSVLVVSFVCLIWVWFDCWLLDLRVCFELVCSLLGFDVSLCLLIDL